MLESPGAYHGVSPRHLVPPSPRPPQKNPNVDTNPHPVESGQTGSDSDETIIGTDASDSIDGFGGNDWLNGKAGRDNLVGGIGNDTIYGESERDWILACRREAPRSTCTQVSVGMRGA
ncbi:hypothetical protein [Microseira wollei]|uniref:Hemolysin-type calcium-binding region n=1 Tax=Microseira wollei NIES-4236 TaxID=2530354 RepID=A0AAV3WQD7_9CYAN|nr:hypothetical protein [Microseira wollei]GET44409.1 hypothetical protein MiSe_92360 [Microseira wollei NIES-4236]